MGVEILNVVAWATSVLVAIAGVFTATMPGRTLRKGQTAREVVALIRELEATKFEGSTSLEGPQMADMSRENRAQLLKDLRVAALISSYEFAKAVKRPGVPNPFSVLLVAYGVMLLVPGIYGLQIFGPDLSARVLSMIGFVLLLTGMLMVLHRLMRRDQMRQAGVPIPTDDEMLKQWWSRMKTRVALRRSKRTATRARSDGIPDGS